jgi:hypothetical protein
MKYIKEANRFLDEEFENLDEGKKKYKKEMEDKESTKSKKEEESEDEESEDMAEGSCGYAKKNMKKEGYGKKKMKKEMEDEESEDEEVVSEGAKGLKDFDMFHKKIEKMYKDLTQELYSKALAIMDGKWGEIEDKAMRGVGGNYSQIANDIDAAFKDWKLIKSIPAKYQKD